MPNRVVFLFIFITPYCSVSLYKTSARQHIVLSGMKWGATRQGGMSAGFDVEQEQQARERLKYFLCDRHGNAEEDPSNDAETMLSV